MFFERGLHLRDGRSFLADGDINANDVFAALIDDLVQARERAVSICLENVCACAASHDQTQRYPEWIQNKHDRSLPARPR